MGGSGVGALGSAVQSLSRFVRGGKRLHLFNRSVSASGAMLLCCVLRTALSVSFGAVVQIVIFLLQNSNILRVQASLPPGAEDEIILIEHLPGRRVHLQDFFWSDAKDAPPWVDPNQGLTIYETRTVHHTVTLYSPSEDKENRDNVFPRTDSSEPSKCTTCIEPTPRLDDDDEDQNIGVLIGEDPGPRYWLLTVLRSGEAVPPKIELKLARLYKTAFLRQQQRHLGLSQTDSRFRRVAREEHPFINKLEIGNHQIIRNFASLSSLENLRRIETNQETTSELVKLENTLLPFRVTDGIENRDEPTRMDDFQSLTTKEASSSGKNISIEVSADIDGNRKLYNVQSISDKDSRRNETSNNTAADLEDINKSKRSELRSLEHGAEVVQVRMQNTSVTDSGATKLIYSVHLGGKPVPAETAARDMSLLSAQEVALELGAPVLIQSEPYLKETRPLALSRKRDAWLLIGAASAGFILLALVVAGLILAAKRKRTHSAVTAPFLSHRISNKRQDYVRTNTELGNNVFSISELEIKTDGTSQRRTPGSLSGTPISLETPDSLDAGIREVLSDDDDNDEDDDDEDDDEQKRKTREPSLWENSAKRSRVRHGRMSRSNAIDTSRTSDSTDAIVDRLETLDSLENNYTRQEEATASPHSYLSMPSCKPFPSMKSVEPLSRVLEPVMVKHLDLDSPELVRREDDRLDDYRRNEENDKFFARTSSATKDPGAVGPIVWNLRKQNFSLEGTSGTEGDLGKTRRRLYELLEDSFSLFGSRDPKSETESYATHRNVPDVLTIFSETKGRSTRASPVSSPLTETKARPRTSFPGKFAEHSAAENGHSIAPFRSRTGWSSRPLSAGPFHRPNLLPDVDARRILTDSQLPPEDPAIPLIASIKKELEKFSPQ